MTSEPFSLQPGDVVGGYTLIARLGAGAMGSVWRVEDGGGTQYAMKILRDSLADPTNKERANARERLRREAMALRKIDNPGVCSIVDMEFDDSFAFIVTELIEGNNLRDDVRTNGRYTGADLERLAAKLDSAMRAVHAAGIVHRDIKPTNVMISTTGPVLVDFGIAMEQGESHVTSTGLVMGTPGFIAPEIIEGAEADEITDWWSVSSVLAFAATGAPVFGTQPMMAVLEREAAGNANLAGLPPRTLAAFRKALAPNRAERCTPEQLLASISADANEMMLPFERTVPLERITMPESPRTAWHDDEEFTIATDMVNMSESGTQLLHLPLNPVTTTVPYVDDSFITELMASEPEEPEVQEPRSTYTQPAPSQPTQPTMDPPPPPYFPAPAQYEVNQRSHYSRRGTVMAAVIGMVLGLLATCLPLVSWLCACILLWLLCALGLNTQSQIQRETRRKGRRNRADIAKRTASMPWHLIKGLIFAIPWAASFTVLYAIFVLACTFITHPNIRDTTLVHFHLSWTMPLPFDTANSTIGLLIGLSCTLAWIIVMLSRRSDLLTIGAGSIITSHRQRQQRIYITSTTVICCILIAALLTLIVQSPIITW